MKKFAHVPRVVLNVIEDEIDLAIILGRRGIRVSTSPTTFTADNDFLTDLVEPLRKEAKRYEVGDLTTDANNSSRAFIEVVDKRMAKCLRDWSNKIVSYLDSEASAG